ncbi:hypothetical protein AKJ09_00066 [Labilithrix luteola]|uniref:Helicase ATP-binding domain-containing protein n=1 Tax=Labilithrix luteola TaxID=1391654 RepID=A0A0K1PIQ9_9BACT|nr:hypothetical protein [Labilithrix luteola]AKU93402.1 hypothetical protein AKJ09_00066 [Labilithrix luteola]
MEIEKTDCLERIIALPRRQPVAPEGLVEQLTELLKTPWGTMRLRALQALALHDIGVCGGGFLPLDVGEGKTLISALAAYVLDAQRPLLLLPANLIQKTAREFRELSEHWLVPNHIRMMSYQMLGLVQSARDLELYNPDVIIFDESQKTKNRDAAVTRRIERYMDAHPETKVVAMTGTIMRKSLLDFAHVLRWALKDGAPVPLEDSECLMWSMCLDTNIENEFMRVEPGALLELADPRDVESRGELVAARRGFQRRLRETPGVVASALSGTDVGVGLTIRPIVYEVSEEMREHFDVLRNDKVTPNGEELWEAAEVWAHSKQMALGFYQRWTPPAPDEWREARRQWDAFVRSILSTSRTWDSPLHVAQACDAGELPTDKLERWRKVKDTFVPNPVPYWVDDNALKVCADWMARGPGLVWTEHVAFAERLSALTGAKYYGAKGLAADGQFIDDADPNSCVIVSIDANREGRNLQRKWHRNLITSFQEGADVNQQLLGRTHRPGQTKDVEVDVLVGCREHVRAWSKANAGAFAIRDTVGSQNKLLIANTDEWFDVDEMEEWPGPEWGNCE